MTDERTELLAFQAKVADLSKITAISNHGDGSGMWRQWIKDIIPMPDGLCMILICRQGSYPYMVNRWEENVADYLPEVWAKLDEEKRESQRMREWQEKMDRERAAKPSNPPNPGAGARPEIPD